MAVHTGLSAGKWQTYTLAEQMGNIGSEVGRASAWKEKNDKGNMMSAFERALELFDLTLGDSRWAGRFKEIARARENVCAVFLDAEKRDHALENYFTQFALAARAKR